MKVKIGSGVEKREIYIGEKGDFILLRTRLGHGYSFAKLEDVVDIKDRHFGRPVPHIKFDGDSYLLAFSQVMGFELPIFTKRHDNHSGKKPGYFDATVLEEVVPGLDNISAYLKGHKDRRYIGHANLIRKVAEAQKRNPT